MLGKAMQIQWVTHLLLPLLNFLLLTGWPIQQRQRFQTPQSWGQQQQKHWHHRTLQLQMQVHQPALPRYPRTVPVLQQSVIRQIQRVMHLLLLLSLQQRGQT